MTFPIMKLISTELFIDKRVALYIERVLEKIGADEKRVNPWAPKSNNKW